MPDRLDELRRQRALIREHLAWLDRQIEEATGGRAESPLPPAAAPLQENPALASALVAAALKAKSVAPPPESPAVAPDAEAILREYEVPPATLRTDVRKGCFLYFAAALVFVAVTVVILYFALRM